MFKRENRYTVLKNKDVACLDADDLATLSQILDKVEKIRAQQGRSSIECVVVEKDWPEYENVWAAIEQRVTDNGPRAVAYETVEKVNGIRGVLHTRWEDVSLRNRETHTFLPLYYLPTHDDA